MEKEYKLEKSLYEHIEIPPIEKAEYKDLFVYGNRKYKKCVVLYFVGSKKPHIISARSLAKGIKKG